MKNAELLRTVANDLAAIEVEAVFFGGTVVGLHLDRLPPGEEERPTVDVDCVPVAVLSSADMRALEARLDQSGRKHDLTGTKRNAYARWSPSGVPVDFVPRHTLAEDDPVRLANPVPIEVAPGCTIQVLSVAGMLAAKLAAFWARGAADPLMSQDLEDLAMLLACSSPLEEDVRSCEPRLQEQIRTGLADVADDPFLLEILEGSFPRGADVEATLQRVARLARQAVDLRRP